MILVGSMAEVEPEHVRPRLEQRANDLQARTRGSERGEDLGVTLASHGAEPLLTPSVIRMARKSLTLVSVGPVTTASPSASKTPWPSLFASAALGLMP